MYNNNFWFLKKIGKILFIYYTLSSKGADGADGGVQPRTNKIGKLQLKYQKQSERGWRYGQRRWQGR